MEVLSHTNNLQGWREGCSAQAACPEYTNMLCAPVVQYSKQLINRADGKLAIGPKKA